MNRRRDVDPVVLLDTPTPDERDRAARYVASRALDVDDARLLLDALGLIDGGERG